MLVCFINFNVLVFVLYLLYLFYVIDIPWKPVCFSNARLKEGGCGWEGTWGGLGGVKGV